MIIERGPEALSTLDPVRQAVVQGQIGDAFHAAFLTVACFTAFATWLAWTLPLRRI